MPVHVQNLLNKSDKLFDSEERTNREPILDELSMYIIPNRQDDYNGRKTRGAKNTKQLFDTTAVVANESLAASIHSILTSPANIWSKLAFQENKDKSKISKIWLEESNNAMHKRINQSNFVLEANRGYRVLTALGSKVLFLEEKDGFVDKFNGYRFQALSNAECAWQENADGLVDNLIRRWKFTAQQAFGKWPDKVSDAIREAAENNPLKEFEFEHHIDPRDENKIKFDSVGRSRPMERPFSSIILDRTNKVMVDEGGYYEQPFAIVRWSTLPGENYGRGPGHIALPDIRSINEFRKLSLQTAALNVRPPMFIRNKSTVNTKINMGPGVVIPTKGKPAEDIMFKSPEVNTTNKRDDFADLTSKIKEIFYIDKLLLPPREDVGEQTAFEIAKRVEQMQFILGPTFGRLSTEFLDIIVRRAFGLMFRKGAFGPTPPELDSEDNNRGVPLDITYINPLARSQRNEEISSIQQFMQAAVGFAQVDPKVVDIIDTDGSLMQIAEILGVSEKVIVSDKELIQKREARAEAEQQEQVAQQLGAAAPAADALSKLDQIG